MLITVFYFDVEIISCTKDQRRIHRSLYVLMTLWLQELSLCLAGRTYYCSAEVQIHCQQNHVDLMALGFSALSECQCFTYLYRVGIFSSFVARTRVA